MEIFPQLKKYNVSVDTILKTIGAMDYFSLDDIQTKIYEVKHEDHDDRAGRIIPPEVKILHSEIERSRNLITVSHRPIIPSALAMCMLIRKLGTPCGSWHDDEYFFAVYQFVDHAYIPRFQINKIRLRRIDDSLHDYAS